MDDLNKGLLVLQLLPWLLVLLLPPLSNWLGRWLQSHSFAVSWWYQGVWWTIREYKRIHGTCMVELESSAKSAAPQAEAQRAA